MVSQRRIVAAASHVVDDAQRRLPRTDTAHRLLMTAVRLARVMVVVMVVVVVMPSAARRRRPPFLRLLELGVVGRRGRHVVLVASQVGPCYAMAV